MRVGFVIQRYGTEILGGSEYHCRLIAERLTSRHQVEVLTTCARDYVTWANEYPEGMDRVRGVTVRRFPNARTRDIASFNTYSDWIFNNAHTRQDEMEWLKQQGPWSPALQEHLEKNASSYDVLIFFTYLYAPTVLGLQVDPSRSLLIPTAHDEPAIHLEIYKDVFGLPAGIGYNTEVERKFLRDTFEIRAVAEEIIGCGVDLTPLRDAPPDADDTHAMTFEPEPLAAHLRQRGSFFRRRHRIDGTFALYGGRIDPGKGCEELFEYFSTYVDEGGDATLFLMGAKLMPIPEEPWVRFGGVLSDQERLHALEAATVVIVPSPYESLSLLALEAFAVGTPVLANERSDVVAEHCRRSNAGLYYGGRDEFVEALRILMGDERLRRAMGRNGREYVRRNYRWDIIIGKYEKLFMNLRQPQAVARRR
ncbi:MAG: glycosyltransferase family 4 protein [Acidobacteriota bacterium]|nr:glycosyltransferase family 4 protein [Acidobacteriota bacterium]